MPEQHLKVVGGEESGELPLDLDGITYYFGRWKDSEPFDIGFATQTALCVIDTRNVDPLNSFRNTKGSTNTSESNGCLMRITPLAVWGHNLPKEQLYEAVKL